MTAVFVYCSSWNDVFDGIIEALRSRQYPAGVVSGGNKNVCAIVGRYTDGPFDLVATNEGSGGAHSEPGVLHHVNHRKLAAGDLRLFTERAPCVDCQASIDRWSDTFDRDIIVQYIVPYSDSDWSTIDIIGHAIQPQSATLARQQLARVRALFPRE